MICIAIAIITWTLSMAETLCEARDQFDNEREFSLWIAAERGEGATPRARSDRQLEDGANVVPLRQWKPG